MFEKIQMVSPLLASTKHVQRMWAEIGWAKPTIWHMQNIVQMLMLLLELAMFWFHVKLSYHLVGHSTMSGSKQAREDKVHSNASSVTSMMTLLRAHVSAWMWVMSNEFWWYVGHAPIIGWVKLSQQSWPVAWVVGSRMLILAMTWQLMASMMLVSAVFGMPSWVLWNKHLDLYI